MKRIFFLVLFFILEIVVIVASIFFFFVDGYQRLSYIISMGINIFLLAILYMHYNKEEKGWGIREQKSDGEFEQE